MAERLCIRIVQNAYLGADIADMREGRKINESSKLIKLNAFLDRENLVRIGGRICRADVDYSIKHPVVLPGESSLAHRIVWQRHLDLMHAGIERVLADLRTEYWIIGGRRSVRRIIGRCLYCRRLSALPKQVMMADLPSERLDFCLPAFTNVGIDFFGPFAVTVKRSTEKRYGCIFTCLVSRAVHLELTPSLSLNSVVLALKRFISRRGRPKVIFSDNGKSFVRAAKCLEEELTNLDLEKLSASASDLRIHWKFSPPNGPHFGGVWERLIGMAKKALTATLQGNTCTDEVLSTVFAEVEALLNGRPLCYIGDDPSNPEPLTPFLLLTGRANVNVPLDITCVKDCTLSKHWCHAQLIVNRFWRRWLKEYLPTLQRRSKWTKDQANLEVGDVVVVVEPQLPRGQWPLGRVTEVVKGSDGRVRIATVRTKHRSYVRPVTRLALIEHLH
uniref:Integrase catalytic domain-containing protein n=1 Tax=Trichuris muris TaxID=70415 RepID=A0A5S6Q3R2_TRIMR